jgi:hypothetical protein
MKRKQTSGSWKKLFLAKMISFGGWLASIVPGTPVED